MVVLLTVLGRHTVPMVTDWVAAKPGPGNLTEVYRERLAVDDVGLLLACDWLHASLYWSR